jgi:transposase InsO family protein
MEEKAHNDWPAVETLEVQTGDLCHKYSANPTQIGYLMCQVTQIKVTSAQYGVHLCHIQNSTHHSHSWQSVHTESKWHRWVTQIGGPICVVPFCSAWRVTVNNETLEFYALTCVDLATNFPKAIRIRSKHASHVGMHFENIWLSRYPRPMKCIHDQDTEFIGADFQEVRRRTGIQDVPTSVHNPQANAVCEQLHQSVGNTLRILLTTNPPNNVTNIVEMIDSSLATALHAARSAIHRTLGVSPGGLVFQRDMFLDIPLLTNFWLIQERRQITIDDNLHRANTWQRHYDYQLGNECLIIQHSPNKPQVRSVYHRIGSH